MITEDGRLKTEEHYSMGNFSGGSIIADTCCADPTNIDRQSSLQVAFAAFPAMKNIARNLSFRHATVKLARRRDRGDESKCVDRRLIAPSYDFRALWTLGKVSGQEEQSYVRSGHKIIHFD